MNKLIEGDSLLKLKELPDNSIDLIASDPPYQLDSIRKRFGKPNSAVAQFGQDGIFQHSSKGFMGKEWDVLPSTELLKECLRVLKPGAFAFWLMTARQDSFAQFVLRLNNAGFVTGFSSLYWVYSTGFPNAVNMSKAVDKRLGYEREVIGTKKAGLGSGKTYAFTENNETDGIVKVTAPKSDEAKKLDGSYAGYQPKPAVEVIIVSMKPMTEKTHVEQALKNNKGITWLDDCRIPCNPEIDASQDRIMNHQEDGKDKGWGMEARGEVQVLDLDKGRFPANVVVSDNVLDDGIERKSSYGQRDAFPSKLFGTIGDIDSVRGHDDEGTISHYFSLDNWWAERFKKLPKEIQDTFPCIIVPKPASSEKNEGIKSFDMSGGSNYNKKCLLCGKWSIQQGKEWQGDYTCVCEKPKYEENGVRHPTVKPIALMSYLITLGSRETETVLDPFAGSGTTCIAAYILNRKFIGIERDAEYFKVATERIGHYTAQKKLGDF